MPTMCVTDNFEAPKELQKNKIRISNKSRKKTNYRKCIVKRVPLFDWISRYNYEWALNDLIAGITLGLTIIPESIACALLAGLPTHYGLCSAFMGSFIYLVGGSIHNVIMGPTSLVALISVKYTIGKQIEFTFILTLLAGIVQLIMGILQMGFLFEFISLPMIKGFSSATAILVIESQIKVLLGIKYRVAGFLPSIKMLIQKISTVQYGDLLMGTTAIIFLWILENLKKCAQKRNANKIVQNSLRYISFARNTLIVLFTGLFTYFWLSWNVGERNGKVPYHLTNNNLSGLPNFTIPQLVIETSSMRFTFWHILKELNIGIFVIPIFGILTNISIGKLSSASFIDTNQELLIVGLCNIMGSCVQSMPTSGAFTRYAISKGCGLKTPMANLYSGIIVLVTLSYLSVYFNLIPEATLAAILICSIYKLLDFKLPVRLWHQSKFEFIIWLLSFSVCIGYGVEMGLFISILVNIFQLLYLWARPDYHIHHKELNHVHYICIQVDNGIYFPAINPLRNKILKAANQAKYKLPIVIDCYKVNGLDFTAAQGLIQLADTLHNLANNLDRQTMPTTNTTSTSISMHSNSIESHTAQTCGLLILLNLSDSLHKMIDKRQNLVLCQNVNELKEVLKQNSLRLGYLNV